MELNMLIILGLLLILFAILFAMPFLGIGMVIPVVGDIIDIPLAAVFGIVGIVLLVAGGLLSVLLEYWYLILAGLVVWFAIVYSKTHHIIAGGKGRKR